MSDVKNLLANIDTNGLVGKILGVVGTKNFAAGLLTGGVGTSLLGGGKETIETVTKVGGLALLGTLAYKAFGNYQQQKASGGTACVLGAVKSSAADMASQTGELLSGLTGGQKSPLTETVVVQQDNPELPLSIIRAMIGAAKADGHMDAAETKKIFDQFEAANLNAHEKALLMQEIANPQDISSIVNIPLSPQESAQIYLAALLVCDSQCQAEKDYLSRLAAALKIEPAFVEKLQQEVTATSLQNAA